MDKNKNLVSHKDELTDEQFKIAKKYVDKLNSYRDKPAEGLVTIGDYNLVQLLGDGDPIKAAEKHKEVLDEMYAEILLSAGDRSKMIH